MVELILFFELLLQPVPYRNLRYEWVVGQAEWYTCGPAAVATLLTYYGISATEEDVLSLAEDFMREMGLDPKQGINALALKRALEAKGIPTKGFRVKPDALKDYFDRGGLPLIAHLTEPQKHFMVAIGFVGDQIVLADPSWGRRIIPFSAFVEDHKYSEVVLVPIPPPELILIARERQAAILEWARLRLQRLNDLRERMP